MVVIRSPDILARLAQTVCLGCLMSYFILPVLLSNDFLGLQESEAVNIIIENEPATDKGEVGRGGGLIKMLGRG